MAVRPQHVLVTDGEHRAALAAVRSLGAAGHRVTVVASRAPCIGTVSRFAAAHATTPAPMRDPSAFASAVWAHAAAQGCEWILPVTEESILALDPSRAPAAGPRLLAPPLDVFRRLSDKATVLETASQLGIRVPRQWTVQNADDPLPEALPRTLVVKAARSVVGVGADRQRSVVQYTDGPDGLRATVAGTPTALFPLLVQERIRGHGIGVFLLRWEGRTVARFAHRRIREKPPTGGVSVCSESVELDGRLEDASERLVSALGLTHGVAMVEYKRDARSGEPVLMEINGRLWGSLQLAIDAGVDFPSLWLACALGEAPATTPAWRAGIRLRWRWGEIDHLIARLRRRYRHEDLPAPEGLVAAVWEVLRPLRSNERSEISRADDPLPSRRETLDWLRRR